MPLYPQQHLMFKHFFTGYFTGYFTRDLPPLLLSWVPGTHIINFCGSYSEKYGSHEITKILYTSGLMLWCSWLGYHIIWEGRLNKRSVNLNFIVYSTNWSDIPITLQHIMWMLHNTYLQEHNANKCTDFTCFFLSYHWTTWLLLESQSFLNLVQQV